METASLGNNRIIEECRALLSKKKISEDDSDIFIQIVEGVLSDYEDYLGGDQEIRYNVLKRFDRVECKIFVKAEKSDPFDEGKGAEERRRIKTVGNVMNNRDASLLYRYSHGYNIVTVRSAKKTGSGNILKQPMVQAALGGLILGLICQQLPVGLNHFIVNKITSPILTISLDVMAGIMGPVVFFSIVKAVSILDDIDALTGLGSRVMKRFLILALCITVICNLVGVVFFPLFGKGNAGYSPGIIIELLLDVIPTSLVVPFVENNIPQLVILALGMGAVLLKMGDEVSWIKDFVDQLAEWLIGFMNTVLVIVPVVPFLSIFNIVARGQIALFIKGWKFIVASYVCTAYRILEHIEIAWKTGNIDMSYFEKEPGQEGA